MEHLKDFKQVKISDIVFFEKAIRKHLPTDPDVIEMITDISNRGLINAPSVTPRDGVFILTDGGRRMTALKQMLADGKIPDEIGVTVIHGLTDEEIIGWQMAGNINIKKTANKQYINGLFQLATAGTMNTEQISKLAGMSIEYIMKLFKTLKFPENVLDTCEKEGVKIGNLIILSELANKIPEEDYPSWIEDAKTLSQRELTIKVADELNAIKQALSLKRDGKKTDEFIVEPVLLSKGDLFENYKKAEIAFNMDSSRDNEITFSVYKKIWQMDEETIATKRRQHEEKLAEKVKKLQERKDKKIILDLEAMKKELENKGFKIQRIETVNNG
jgi:hypothetical protein